MVLAAVAVAAAVVPAQASVLVLETNIQESCLALSPQGSLLALQMTGLSSIYST